MKYLTFFLTVSLSLFFIVPEVDARGGGGGGSRGGGASRGGGGGASRSGGGGGSRNVSRPSASQRDNRSAKRSPMTGSKIERPQSRPVSRPESRPASRPESRPASRPSTLPAQRPSIQKPTTRPDSRPGNIPDRRPDAKPADRLPDKRPGGDNRPDFNRPDNRPDNRPSLERPGTNRPTTLPGMVTYPNRPNNRPGNGDRPGFGNGSNRPGIGNGIGNNNVNIGNINVGGRNVGLNRPSTLPARSRDWDTNRWGGNNGVWGNRVNIGNDININNNFYGNNNYAYRPNYWGARPWWGAGNYHGWHHGHWNYGWNSSYYNRHWYYNDNSFARGFMWGIGVWSLGNLIYDMGYQTYRNPYPAPAVQNTYITYAEPVSVAAAANPPGDEKVAELAETKSNEVLERSRAAFKQGDYLTASKAVDEAIAYTPGDVTLHEYRALVFFALGKYADAAGILNPTLASGPGWSWDTMIGFYNGSEAYNTQLRSLESYVKKSPEKADAHFLLGYHYMVCGHMEKSYEQFAKAAELQPADSISRQLRDLTKSSIPDGGDSDGEAPAIPAPVPAEQLVGIWVSDRGQDGKVTFTLTQGGDYTWSYMNGAKSTDMKGTYGLDDKGLLVLTSDDTQMVSAIEMKDTSKLHFTLIGAPDGDPGLDFVKK
ncbi:MAG: tetratricopeptide repeat protein [Gloeobacteraceae cyanobacterium ES-bin-144]|nr:tetratricopeptide repeat protein [Verrucomicrobiales bacterium]